MSKSELVVQATAYLEVDPPSCPHHAEPLVCGECGEPLSYWFSGSWLEPSYHTHQPGSKQRHAPTVAHRVTVCGVCGDAAWRHNDADNFIGEPHDWQPVERIVECTA